MFASPQYWHDDKSQSSQNEIQLHSIAFQVIDSMEMSRRRRPPRIRFPLFFLSECLRFYVV